MKSSHPSRSRAFLPIAVSLACGVALAAPITLDGRLTDDWGVTMENANDFANQLNWFPSIGVLWLEDDSSVNGIHGYVEPGYGGQDFDVEAMYALLYIDDMGDPNPLNDTYTLYVALVQGLNPGGEDGYRWGDLFVDFGGEGWDLAARLVDLSLPANGTEETISLWGPGSGTWWTNPTDYPGSAPYRHNSNADPAGSAQAAWRNPTSNDHNTAELALDLTDAQLDEWRAGGELSLHWTQSCGNDVVDWSVPITPPRAPLVPEPSTIGLLGLGIAGVLLRRRFWA